MLLDYSSLETALAAATLIYGDLETRSLLDLRDVGHYAYAEHPSTEILLIFVASDDGPVHTIDLTAGPAPQCLINALASKPFTSWGAFDYVVLNVKLLGPLALSIKPENFYDISAHAQMLTVHRELKQACRQLGVTAGEEKFATGRRLIELFSVPNKDGDFADPTEYQAEWAEFMRYGAQDVVAARACHKRLRSIAKWPAKEHQVYAEMLRINDRGMPVDAVLVRNAQAQLKIIHENVLEKFHLLTGIDSFHKHAQVKRWCADEGLTLESIREAIVTEYLKNGDQIPENVKRLFEIKQEQPKAAVIKYRRIAAYMSSDERLRGMYTYHRAGTGRFSSTGPMVHNLAKPPKYIPGSDKIEFPTAEITEAVRRGEWLPGIDHHLQLKSIIRSAFRTTDDRVFVVRDFRQVEQRYLACVAGCEKILAVYRSGGSLYTQFSIEKLGAADEIEAADTKALAKVAILGCGFEMGWIRFKDYAEAWGIKLTEQAAQAIVYGFRTAYPEIVHLWKAIEEAVRKALRDKSITEANGHVVNATDPTAMSIRLLSGRRIWYRNASLDVVEGPTKKGFGFKTEIRYDGAEENGVVMRIGTYGGKLTENIIQAGCRDLLTNAVRLCHLAGLQVVGTVHDEVICEAAVSAAEQVKNQLAAIMRVSPDWCKDLPLDAEGYVNQFYRKD